MSSKKVLSQHVVHPVASGENTDSGPRHNAPSNHTADGVVLHPGVNNPVGNHLNTDAPGFNADKLSPIPMRPIPS